MPVPAINVLATNANGAYVNNEARVNGIFNMWLNRYFPTASSYFVIPEALPKYNDTQSLKTDLLVAEVFLTATGQISYRPILAYEGKGNPGKTLVEARKQLFDWLWATDLGGGRKTCWAIAVKAKEVKFWKWDRSKNDDGDKMMPVDWDGTNNILRVKNGGHIGGILPDSLQAYDLSNINHINTIDVIIQSMAANPLAT